jgi:hypothetical protein
MKTSRYIAGIAFLVLLGSCISALAQQGEPGPSVLVSETFAGNQATYHYRLVNNGERAATALWIGYDYFMGLLELPEPPARWTVGAGLPDGSATSPIGWEAGMVAGEATGLFRVEWGANDPSHDLIPGQSLDGFSVMLSQPVREYLSVHWTVEFDDGSVSSGVLARGPAAPDATDITRTIIPGGPPVDLTFDVPGRNARLTFTGTVGDRINLLASNATVVPTYIYIANVMGQVLTGPTLVETTGAFIDTWQIPSSDSYIIIIDPEGLATGSLRVSLYPVLTDGRTDRMSSGPLKERER